MFGVSSTHQYHVAASAFAVHGIFLAKLPLYEIKQMGGSKSVRGLKRPDADAGSTAKSFSNSLRACPSWQVGAIEAVRLILLPGELRQPIALQQLIELKRFAT